MGSKTNERTYDVVETLPVFDEPQPTSDIENVVECEFMVYGVFRGRFANLDARRDYSGTHLYVPCANGQISRITVRTLSAEEATKYRQGEAP